MEIEKSTMEVTTNGIVIRDHDKNMDLRRHTEEVHEIIVKVPSWLMRCGITVFLSLLLIFFAMSSLIKYPDTIKIPFKIESRVSPQAVVSNDSGRITKVFITRYQQVKEGQALIRIRTDRSSEYELRAPQDGKVFFTTILQVGERVKATQQLLAILPVNPRYHAALEVPQNRINKLKVGQAVLMKINEYRHGEQDYLKGRISFIADVPVGNKFSVRLSWEDKSEKDLHLKNWMTGEAEIVTEDITLQARIYRNLFNNNQ